MHSINPTPAPADSAKPGRLRRGIAAGLVGLLASGAMVAVAAPAALAQDDASTEQAREGEFRGRVKARLAARVDNVAATIGVDREVVLDGLAAGMSLSEIAEANGVSAEALIAAIIDHTSSRIEEKLADGTIDQAKADAILENIDERVTERVNRMPGERLRDRLGQRAGG